MEVEYALRAKSGTLLEEIPEGNTFLSNNYSHQHDKRLYLVIEHLANGQVETVCLNTGKLGRFGRLCVVEKCDAKVLVTYEENI